MSVPAAACCRLRTSSALACTKRHYRCLGLHVGVWAGRCPSGCVRRSGGAPGGRGAAGLQCHRLCMCAAWASSGRGWAPRQPQGRAFECWVQRRGHRRPQTTLTSHPRLPSTCCTGPQTARRAAARRTRWRGGSCRRRPAASSPAPLSTSSGRSRRVGGWAGGWVLGVLGWAMGLRRRGGGGRHEERACGAA